MNNLNDILFLPLDLPTLKVDYDKLLDVYKSLGGLPDEYSCLLYTSPSPRDS